MKPIMVNKSNGWKTLKFSNCSAKMPPTVANGMVITTNKLSLIDLNNAAINKNKMTKAKAKFSGVCLELLESFFEGYLCYIACDHGHARAPSAVGERGGSKTTPS